MKSRIAVDVPQTPSPRRFPLRSQISVSELTSSFSRLPKIPIKKPSTESESYLSKSLDTSLWVSTTPFQTPRRSPRRHSSSSTPNRTARKRGHVSDDDDDLDSDVEGILVSRSRKLKLGSPGKDARSPLKRSKTLSSSIPNRFERLEKGLPDRLMNNLDIVFCGINPSLTSEGNKLHYSGNGNQFWHCLRQANFIPPDITYESAPELPQRFCIGLTDLVARATASAKEIPKSEILESIPLFFRKIASCRPRIVCFLSLGIGEIVSSAISCPWEVPKAPRKAGQGRSKSSNSRSRSRSSSLSPRNSSRYTPQKSSSSNPAKPAKLADIREYMLPIKLRYHDSDSRLDTGNIAAETLFIAMPSTSGANACSYYVEDKIALFKELNSQLQLIKQGSSDAPDTAEFKVLDLVKVGSEEVNGVNQMYI